MILPVFCRISVVAVHIDKYMFPDTFCTRPCTDNSYFCACQNRGLRRQNGKCVVFFTETYQEQFDKAIACLPLIAIINQMHSQSLNGMKMDSTFPELHREVFNADDTDTKLLVFL